MTGTVGVIPRTDHHIGTAAGVCYSLSHAPSTVMPFVAVPALAAFGPVAVFSVSAFPIVVLCLDVGLLGPRSTGLRLEEVQQMGS